MYSQKIVMQKKSLQVEEIIFLWNYLLYKATSESPRGVWKCVSRSPKYYKKLVKQNTISSVLWRSRKKKKEKKRMLVLQWLLCSENPPITAVNHDITPPFL